MRSKCSIAISGRHAEANHLSPSAVAFHQKLTSNIGRCAVPSNSEVVAYHAERSQELLGVLGRLEPAHQPLTLARRLV
jgi:hypothetical protein